MYHHRYQPPPHLSNKTSSAYASNYNHALNSYPSSSSAGTTAAATASSSSSSSSNITTIAPSTRSFATTNHQNSASNNLNNNNSCVHNNNNSNSINNSHCNNSNSSNSGGLYSGLSKHYIEERQDVIFRKVRGILNKITPETFDKLSKELVNVGLDSPRTLRGVIYLLFDKALKDLKYSSLYAKLCQELSEKAPNFEQEPGPNTFCKFLISKCEDEFERRRKATEDFESKNELTDEEYEQKAIVKQKMLGNIKFICELGKKRLLQEEILHECIRGLLSKKKERPIQDQAQDLECLCQIMRTIGSLLDVQASKNLMNQYFERIDLFSKKPELPPRIRFMLRDVIDLRNNNWRPRPFQREDNVPQPLSKLREEAGYEHTPTKATLDKYGNTTFGDLSKLHGNKLSMLLDDEPSFTTSTDFHWGPSFLDQPTFDPFSSSNSSNHQKPTQQQSQAYNHFTSNTVSTTNAHPTSVHQKPPPRHDPFANHNVESMRKQPITNTSSGPVRNNFESGNRFLDGIGGFKRAPFRDMDNVNPPRRERERENPNLNHREQQQFLPPPIQHQAISNNIVNKQSSVNSTPSYRHQQPCDEPIPFSNFNTSSRRFGSGFRDDRLSSQRDARTSPILRQPPHFQSQQQQARRYIPQQAPLTSQQPQPNITETVRQGPHEQTADSQNHRFDHQRSMHGDRDMYSESNENRRFVSRPNLQSSPPQHALEPFVEHRQPRFSSSNFRQTSGRNDRNPPIPINTNQATHSANPHPINVPPQVRPQPQPSLSTAFQPHPNFKHPPRGNVVGDLPIEKKEPPRRIYSANYLDRDQVSAPNGSQSQKQNNQVNQRFLDGPGHLHAQERSFRPPISRPQRDLPERGHVVESDRSNNWRRSASMVAAANNQVGTPAENLLKVTPHQNQQRPLLLSQHQHHNHQQSQQHHQQQPPTQKQPLHQEPQLAQTIGPLLPKPPTKISDSNFSLRPSHNLAGRVHPANNGIQSSAKQNQTKTNVSEKENQNFKPIARFQESTQALPPPSSLPPVKLGQTNPNDVGESKTTNGTSSATAEDTSLANSTPSVPKSDFQIEKFSSILADCLNDPTTNINRVAAKVKELKIPKEHQYECLVSAMKQSILKGEKDREIVGKLFVQLLPSIFDPTSLMNAFKVIFEQLHSLEIETPKVKSLVAGFLSQSTVDSLLTIEEVGNVLSGGKHHPLFLLYLQKLGKSAGQVWLHEKFIASKINLMDMLPEADKSKERLASILKDRCLGFLDTMLTIEPDLWEQMKEKDPSPASIYRWIKDNVEQSIQNTPPFAQVLVTCLLKHIHNIAKTHSEQKESNTGEAEQSSNKSSPSNSSSQSIADIEKDLLAKYQQMLQAMLKDKQMQLAALYALQSFYYKLDFPKGSLLRWFHMLYDMNVVDNDVFFVWKEEINDEIPGKGQALFQVNTWLNWLAEAESEDEDDDDEED